MKIDAAALLDGTVNIAGAAKKEDIAVRAEERETFAVYKPEGTSEIGRASCRERVFILV